MTEAYSDDVSAPFTLIIDGASSPVPPDDKGLLVFRDDALLGCSRGKEVKVTNKDGLIIYHSLGTKVLHPTPIGNFWKDIVKK